MPEHKPTATAPPKPNPNNGSPPTFLRKNIRLPADNYRGGRMYFLTLCFAGRAHFGKNPRIASWLIQCLTTQAAHSGFFVHAYCVMPDHLHALLCAASDASDLMAFVQQYKQETAFNFAPHAARTLAIQILRPHPPQFRQA
jgi:REP element-mobilizing transposase RayT